MNNMESRWLALKHLDELASQDTIIHRLNPVAKLLTTFLYLLAVTSFSKTEVTALIPLCLYPFLLINIGELPYRLLIKRLCLALPFILFVGVFNPIFDTTPALEIGQLTISYGWLSFISIVLRSLLAVAAALILLATTGIEGIGLALLSLKVPRLFVLQILFMYRYLYVLAEELTRTLNAHAFRSFSGEGLGYKVWGSLLGQLLLRTIDRAQRIYHAMLCRGFDGEIRFMRKMPFRLKDYVYLIGWTVYFLISRCINIPQWLGTLLLGGSH